VNDICYKPKYFKVKELVSPEHYDLLGEGALSLFHPHTLRMLDSLRQAYGKSITINNYAKGYRESGLRHLTTKTGALRSAHKKAYAFDLKAYNMNSLRAFLKERSQDFFISRIENFDKTKGKNQDWCHIEISTELVEKTKYFNP